MLKSNVDYSEEVHFDPLIRNTAIQLCLSIQVSLGFKGEFVPRTFSGKFGWIVLQLRNIVVLVTMAANMKVPSGINNERVSPLENPGKLLPTANLVYMYANLIPSKRSSMPLLALSAGS